MSALFPLQLRLCLDSILSSELTAGDEQVLWLGRWMILTPHCSLLLLCCFSQASENHSTLLNIMPQQTLLCFSDIFFFFILT